MHQQQRGQGTSCRETRPAPSKQKACSSSSMVQGTWKQGSAMFIPTNKTFQNISTPSKGQVRGEVHYLQFLVRLWINIIFQNGNLTLCLHRPETLRIFCAHAQRFAAKTRCSGGSRDCVDEGVGTKVWSALLWTLAGRKSLDGHAGKLGRFVMQL